MPVVGAFQWLATQPGLEALGGVALAPVLGAVAGLILDKVGLKQTYAGPDGKPVVMKRTKVAQGALTAIGMWELGKAVGSPNLAKFGAFYALGRMVEDLITVPMVLGKVQMLKDAGLAGLGDDGIYGLGTYRENDMAPIGDTVRIPDTQELVGIGDTVRVPDTSTIGTVRIPDTSMEGDEVEGFGDDEVSGDEAEVGAENSDLF